MSPSADRRGAPRADLPGASPADRRGAPRADAHIDEPGPSHKRSSVSLSHVVVAILRRGAPIAYPVAQQGGLMKRTLKFAFAAGTAGASVAQFFLQSRTVTLSGDVYSLE